MSTVQVPRDATIIKAARAPHRSTKAPAALVLSTLLAAVVLIGLRRSGATRLVLAATGSSTLPSITLPAEGTGIMVTAFAAVLTAFGLVRRRARKTIPVWIGALLAVDLLVGFLVWAAAGHALPVVGLLAGSLALSVPLIFGALGGVLCERVGIVNVAIEGQLLAGAFASSVVASTTGSLVAGLLAAAAAGLLVSAVLAVFAIKYFVDQVIVGVVLNVLVLGLTNFLYTSVLVSHPAQLNSPPQFLPVAIPGLSAIPVIGPVLFDQTVIVYLMYVTVPTVTYALFRTRWGLRLRAVGEHPRAADTVGVDVRRTRLHNVAFAGAIAGTGGAYFTLAAVPSFTKDVTSGVGFIALAAVIFGRWNPVRASLAALAFGFVSNLQNVLGLVGSPIPGDVLLMLPYAVTIVAVAGLVGRVRGPAAAGRAYE